MRPLLIPGLLIAVASAAPAHAQVAPVTPAPGPGQPPATIVAEAVGLMIAAFDADGDARVTRAEFDAGLRRSFDSVDRGGTGAIGYIAFGDWAARWLGDANALPGPFEVDRNGDNRITFEEMAARFDQLFARFDANADGVIVRSELLTVRTPPMPRLRGREPEQAPTQRRR